MRKKRIHRDIIILNGVNDFQQKKILILRFDSSQYARPTISIICVCMYAFIPVHE